MVGHVPSDSARSPQVQVAAMLACARDMIHLVRTLEYPATLGMMELRVGLHCGPASAGVLGVRYPRYTLFGTTPRLAAALQASALPMSVHVSEMVHQRLKGPLGDAAFVPYTLSTFPGVGIIKTYLVGWVGCGKGGGGGGGGGDTAGSKGEQRGGSWA